MATQHWPKSDSEADLLKSIDARYVEFDNPEMPPSLLEIPDPPPLLRVKGMLPRMPCIAVVGTRRSTEQGVKAAATMATHLSRHGVGVVSGGARGIDAAVHRAVLRAGGHTTVVLGSGLASPYPPEHVDLFNAVVEAGGAVVSELPVAQTPRPGFFPRRNRIISGLSLGVLVIEAPRRSGAMLTAKLAVEQHGRQCWVRMSDPSSYIGRGGLEAIRDGWAVPVMDAIDVLADLNTGGALTAEQQVLAAMIKAGAPADAQALASALHWPVQDVLQRLTALHVIGAAQVNDAGWQPTSAGTARASCPRR